MNKNDTLEKFNHLLKKFPTNEVAKIFAKFERYYLKNYKGDPIKKIFNDKYHTYEIIINPILFNEIISYSTNYNDYKNETITESKAWSIFEYYYNYNILCDNEYADENYSKTDKNILPQIIYGHMQDQGIYQISPKFYENRFNRNYYLLANVDFNNKTLDSIIQEKFKIDLKSYIKNLVIICLLSISCVVLNDQEPLGYIGDQEIYLDIIDELSVSYEDCRNNSSQIARKNIFKIKPVLKSQVGEYIVPSFQTMLYNVSDKLYWIYKDYFKTSSVFVNKFGIIFENYVYEILVKQFGKENVIKLPRIKNKKSADFKISCNNYSILIEVKSGVARVNAKTTNLIEEDYNFFRNNNVIDAMKQLDASADKIINKSNLICIILNYDQLYVEDGMLFDISTNFYPKHFDINNLLLFNIDNFERFICTYNSLVKIEELCDKYKNKQMYIHKILEKCELQQNIFFEDRFNKIANDFLIKNNTKK